MLFQVCDDVPFGARAYTEISTHSGARTTGRGLSAEACFSIVEVPSHWHFFFFCVVTVINPPPPPPPTHLPYVVLTSRFFRLESRGAVPQTDADMTCPTAQNQGLSKAFFYTPEVSQNVALHALSAARQSRAIKGSLSYG